MSKLFDFLYADTMVVMNKKNCHDSNQLDEWASIKLSRTLPLLNSLQLNLKNIKELHKHLFNDLLFNAGKTKAELGIEGESNKDFETITKNFGDNWLKKNISGINVDGQLFASEMASLLVFGETNNPFLYGSLDTFCVYVNYIAKVNGIDIDFTKLNKVKEIASSEKNIDEMTKLIHNAMLPLSLEETNVYRKHFGLDELSETKIISRELDNNRNGFILSSKGKTCDKTFFINNQETEKSVSVVSNTAEAIVHLEHYIKEKNTAWRKTDKIINEENKEQQIFYDLNKFGEDEVVRTVEITKELTKEYNHRNAICTTRFNYYKDAFVHSNFNGTEIIGASDNILTKIDLNTLNNLTDNGKHLETIKEKYIIHKVNDDKLAIISDVRMDGKNYEAIINYDNENYLVKDFGVRKGMLDYYKLDNKIKDSTFEAYDKTEIYSTGRGMEME